MAGYKTRRQTFCTVKERRKIHSEEQVTPQEVSRKIIPAIH
jgi:hypothetical protein